MLGYESVNASRYQCRGAEGEANGGKTITHVMDTGMTPLQGDVINRASICFGPAIIYIPGQSLVKV